MHVRLRILEAKRQRGIGVSGIRASSGKLATTFARTVLVRAVNQAEYAIGIIIGAGGVLRVRHCVCSPLPESIPHPLLCGGCA